MMDQQEVEWLAHVEKCKAVGTCPHSGSTVTVCKATICDCFDPYATGSDLHPEYFQIGVHDEQD